VPKYSPRSQGGPIHHARLLAHETRRIRLSCFTSCGRGGWAFDHAEPMSRPSPPFGFRSRTSGRSPIEGTGSPREEPARTIAGAAVALSSATTSGGYRRIVSPTLTIRPIPGHSVSYRANVSPALHLSLNHSRLSFCAARNFRGSSASSARDIRSQRHPFPG
jgi:hypothetical protein